MNLTPKVKHHKTEGKRLEGKRKNGSNIVLRSWDYSYIHFSWLLLLFFGFVSENRFLKCGKPLLSWSLPSAWPRVALPGTQRGWNNVRKIPTGANLAVLVGLSAGPLLSLVSSTPFAPITWKSGLNFYSPLLHPSTHQIFIKQLSMNNELQQAQA